MFPDTELKRGVPMIIDDIGIAWYYLEDENRITVIERESGEYADGGFLCYSFAVALHQLREGGYIS